MCIALECVVLTGCRVGLIGNPSDGFYGKTISLTIANFWAEVTVTESPRLVSSRHCNKIYIIIIHCNCHEHYYTVVSNQCSSIYMFLNER